jgi:hypothetical protein
MRLRAFCAYFCIWCLLVVFGAAMALCELTFCMNSTRGGGGGHAPRRWIRALVKEAMCAIMPEIPCWMCKQKGNVVHFMWCICRALLTVVSRIFSWVGSREARCWSHMPKSSGWPRLLRCSGFPKPCLARTALTTRFSRSTALRAGLVSLLHAILAPAPDALVLAEG